MRLMRIVSCAIALEHMLRTIATQYLRASHVGAATICRSSRTRDDLPHFFRFDRAEISAGQIIVIASRQFG